MAKGCDMHFHDCDICGSSDARWIWPAMRYVTGDPPCICNNCGFVYVQERRTSAEIAEDWKRIYAEGLYDPTWPGVKARLYYVAEWIDQNIGLEGKRVFDIGSGKGFFQDEAKRRGASTFGLEPAFGAEIIDNYKPSEHFGATMDIVTILWTLENCGDCNAMISKARECLKPDGHLIVATGSRILVPFRKPMEYYFSKQPQDLHAFRWSPASLVGILRKHGFAAWDFNDYYQNDVLLVSAVQTLEAAGPFYLAAEDDTIHRDRPTAVENHFIDWYRSFP